MNKNRIAGLVLTLNEAINIEKCIRSLSFCDTIVVFDSFSKDDTLLIAKRNGAEVYQRVFDNYAAQRNAALRIIQPKFDWVLMIDADEVISESLKEEILSETQKETNDIAMYLVRRKDHFMGQWIKRSSGYPTWFARLFRNGEVSVEREINEEYKANGKKAYLKGHLLHYPFSKGLDWWFEKHNQYSSMEAISLVNEFNQKIPWKYGFSSDPILKRKFQKQLIYRLPFKPVLIFIIMYVFRGGFLDGKAGLRFCQLRYVYEQMISLKIKEKDKLS